MTAFALLLDSVVYSCTLQRCVATHFKRRQTIYSCISSSSWCCTSIQSANAIVLQKGGSLHPPFQYRYLLCALTLGVSHPSIGTVAEEAFENLKTCATVASVDGIRPSCLRGRLRA